MIFNKLRSLLKYSVLYTSFQKLLDGGARQFCVEKIINVLPDEKILDLGCGTGNMFPYIDAITPNYFGIDINPRYIKYAKKKYSLDKFQTINVADFLVKQKFDKVVAYSLLHHISDETALKMLRNVPNLLVEQGEFVAIEPLYYKDQTFGSYLYCKLDRGKFIRTEKEYTELVHKVFDNVEFEFLGKISRGAIHFCVIKAKFTTNNVAIK